MDHSVGLQLKYPVVVILDIEGLLIYPLISENQGLEKSRSISNLRKISGSANLNFFRLGTLIFFRFIV
jgi:hypothetical protein